MVELWRNANGRLVIRATMNTATTPQVWTYSSSLTGYVLVLERGLWRMRMPAHPIEGILCEIEKALAAGLYHLAIVLAVTLPDVCAALESADGRSNTPRYKAWFESNMATRFSNLTADDCFSLRCGVVHQGRFGLAGSQYDRAVFLLPNPQGGRFRDCIMNDAYFYSADDFCREWLAGVREWVSKKGTDPQVAANSANLIRTHPNGLSPYVKGAAVIA